MGDPMTPNEAQSDASRERVDEVRLSVFERMEALAALTSDDWNEASAWADAAKRLQPDMTNDRWQGIRHGYAAGIASRASRTSDHAAAVAAGRAEERADVLRLMKLIAEYQPQAGEVARDAQAAKAVATLAKMIEQGDHLDTDPASPPRDLRADGRAEGREAAAKACETLQYAALEYLTEQDGSNDTATACEDCAAAIRALATTPPDALGSQP